ncbi:hypothetical protein [Parablautia muri]|jgi:hypothetical protein|uniref:Uncharacterized protein n=1 Tax=Parablautia muri TaxID=2320879 RepID=A0A9X5BJZ1_9FIRM|nr:hypothetical protein [Parablautia muri]NBJ95446.1 hypothetical protein [Parablautia muri]
MQNKTNKNNTQLNKKLNTEYKNIKLEPITAQLIEEVENDKDYKENEKFDVNYFSTYCAQFRDYDFIYKVQQFGFAYLGFIDFLKSEMLDFGKYYVYEKYITMLINKFCFTYNIEFDVAKSIYDDLIESNYISIIQCSCFKSPIVVEPTIFYNYRLVQEQRVRNRLKKRKERADKKESETETVDNKATETEEAPSEPLPEVPVAEPDTPIKPDDFGFGETYEENPFF